MSNNRIDYSRIRQEVDNEMKRYQMSTKIGFFIGHLLLAIGVTIAVWWTGLSNPDIAAAFKDPNSTLDIVLVFPLILAIVGVLFHGLTLAVGAGLMTKQAREKATMATLTKEIMRLGLDADDLEAFVQSEKPKRRQTIQLTDDGELAEPEQTALRRQQAESQD